MISIHQGDLTIAEPHAGHDPSTGNIRRHFLVVSNHSYNQRSGLVCGLAITHIHRESPYRFPIMDFASGTNGDVLLLQLLSTDFVARHGKVIGHIRDQHQLQVILNQVRHIFDKETS